MAAIEPDAILMLLPADQFIADSGAFIKAIQEGIPMRLTVVRFDDHYGRMHNSEAD